MATMVTVDDIEMLFGRDLTEAEEEEVQLYIDFAIGEIEAYLGRPVTITTFEDEEVLPDANGSVYFKWTPVVSIGSMTINSELVVDPAEFVTLTPYGFDTLWEQTLNIPPLTVTEVDRIGFYGAEVLVTYDAGLDFPNAIKGLVTRGVLRKFREEVANRSRTASGHSGIKKIQVEDYALEYERPLASSRSSGTSSILIFESETDFWPIKRYKRRAIV